MKSKVLNCILVTLVVKQLCYLFDSLEKSWRFPGRDGKATVYEMCPQKSGKEHCSLGEALNPAVSSAVLASCSGMHRKILFIVKNKRTNCHY